MKTSNKFLIITTVVILIFLVIYDHGLKAEYLKGEFRERFYQMEELSFKNFNNIRHDAGDMVGINIEKGDKYQVWIKSFIKDEITIKQQGQTLIICATNKDRRLWGYNDGITIICPNLDSLTTTSDAEANNKHFDYQSSSYNVYNHICKFSQPKMVLKLNKLTAVELDGNNLDELEAVVGDKQIGKAYLDINYTNTFKVANIQLPGKSDLKLENPTIGKLNYTIADSGKITTFGKSLSLIK